MPCTWHTIYIQNYLFKKRFYWPLWASVSVWGLNEITSGGHSYALARMGYGTNLSLIFWMDWHLGCGCRSLSDSLYESMGPCVPGEGKGQLKLWDIFKKKKKKLKKDFIYLRERTCRRTYEHKQRGGAVGEAIEQVIWWGPWSQDPKIITWTTQVPPR